MSLPLTCWMAGLTTTLVVMRVDMVVATLAMLVQYTVFTRAFVTATALHND